MVALVRKVSESGEDPVTTLRRAHHDIVARVRPVYALDEGQPSSRTLTLGRGSCSQRLAVLESVARSIGVSTRVRGLLVDGRFWNPRFPRMHVAVPDEVLVAWPEFRIDGDWFSPSGLFGHVGPVAAPGELAVGFTNSTGETLFDAIARTAVDWDGVTSPAGECSACDLSARVLRDLGRFDSRDALFGAHGQTLSWPARMIAGPVLSRWSAGATRPMSGGAATVGP